MVLKQKINEYTFPTKQRDYCSKIFHKQRGTITKYLYTYISKVESVICIWKSANSNKIVSTVGTSYISSWFQCYKTRDECIELLHFGSTLFRLSLAFHLFGITKYIVQWQWSGKILLDIHLIVCSKVLCCMKTVHVLYKFNW